jgi:Porin PorA
VMDRSTVENVADDRAFAFDPANVVDRSQAYRLNLPFDTSTDQTYAIYKNEIDGTYEIAADTETATGEVEGLDVSYFVANVDEAPLSDAYLAELSKAVPLPESLTLEEMKPQLLAAGIDVDAVLAALTPVLTPEDTATLTEFAGEPIGLDYVISFGGRMAVEPVTGADVQVAVGESVGVRPQVTSLPAVLAVLGHYPEVPEAVAAGTALNELVAGPAVPLFDYSYEQTPASVTDVANDVSAMRQQVLLAKVWLPLALAGAALLSLAIGAAIFLRRRPRPMDVTGIDETEPLPRPTEDERELVSTTGKG